MWIRPPANEEGYVESLPVKTDNFLRGEGVPDPFTPVGVTKWC